MRMFMRLLLAAFCFISMTFSPVTYAQSTSGEQTVEASPAPSAASPASVEASPATEDASSEKPPLYVGGRRDSDGEGRPLPDIVWNEEEWRRFQPWQFGVLGGMAGLVVTSMLLKPDFEEPRWDSSGPIDDAIQRRFGGIDENVARGFGRTSDILYPTLGLLPLVLEDALMLPLARRSPDVALQTFLIDMQSIGFTSVFYFGGQAIVGRSRPGLSRCIEDNDGIEDCTIGTGIKSFFSGHAAIAFTGAGLICTHQAYLGVYENDTVGRALCGITMTAATATSIFRIVADRHWTSDVLFGAGLGLFSGLALPRLIHFNPPRLRRGRGPQATFMMLPDLRRDHVGVQLFSAF